MKLADLGPNRSVHQYSLHGCCSFVSTYSTLHFYVTMVLISYFKADCGWYFVHFLFLLTTLEEQACDLRVADSISVWNDRMNLGGESERAVLEPPSLPYKKYKKWCVGCSVSAVLNMQPQSTLKIIWLVSLAHCWLVVKSFSIFHIFICDTQHHEGVLRWLNPLSYIVFLNIMYL